MTKFGIPLLAAGLLAGIGSIAAVPAFAQTMLPPADAGAAWRETGSRTIQPMLFGQHIEDKIAFFKAALKITPAQEMQWAILAAAMRENAKALDQATMLARRQSLPLDATRRRVVREVFDKVQDENEARIRSAIKLLYPRLSRQQQKMANALFVDDSQRYHG